MTAEQPILGWRALMTPDALPRFALIVFGTWLTAADALVTATMMPTIAHDIGGYAWFGWSVAGYVLGSILAGASSGRLSLRLGLRRAMMLGGLTYAVGCAASALGPNIFWFLAGRVVQGIGGGWTSGLCYVAVTAMFPERLWPRVLSGLAGVWGVATLSSPLIGGLFAEAGFWRGGFWLFAAQGLLFIPIVAALVPRQGGEGPSDAPLAWRQVLALGAGIVALSSAGVVRGWILTAGLATAGLALLAWFLRLDARAPGHMLPRRAADLASAEGAGLAMIFAFCCATTNYNVYGSAMMQALLGASPVVAGYILVLEAVGWTLAALAVSGVRGEAGAWPIRLGPVLITIGIASLAWAAPFGGLTAIAICAFVQGSGFGLAWALASSRIAGAAPEPERALASSAIPTTQLIGTAAGAALSALIANLYGFDRGITPANAHTGGVILFAAFLPLAVFGIWAGWKLASPRFATAEG